MAHPCPHRATTGGDTHDAFAHDPDFLAVLDHARTESTGCDRDDPYCELMATYAALGELLRSGPGYDDAAGYSDECRDLVRRLIGLGSALTRRAVRLERRSAGVAG